MNQGEGAGVRAAPLGQRYVLFAVVSVALLVSSMQFSMVSVALPDIIDGLDAPFRWVGWIITVFALAQAVSMPIAGKLSDELGRRNVFAAGLVVFAVASVACAVAPNVYALIAARAVQGLAGGSLLPSAYGIIGDAFADNRPQALGMISSVFPIGGIIGPNAGGVIVDNLGWRWTFGLNAPLVALVVVVILIVMREQPGRRSSPIDYRGAALLTLGVSALIYALTELGQRDADPSMLIVAVALLTAVAGGLLFIRQESRTADPVVDLALLRRREFAFVNTLNFFYGMSVFGMFAFIPLYAQSEYGMTSSETGALLTPRAMAMIGASTLAALTLPRTGYRKPIIGGMLIMAGAFIAMSLGIDRPNIAGVELSNFVYLAVIVMFTGVGFGISGPAANNAAIELAPDRVAAVTGLRGMFRSLGGAIGTAIIVLITSRADSTAAGLEVAFTGLAVVTVLTSLLVFGISDEVGGAVAVSEPAAPPAGSGSGS